MMICKGVYEELDLPFSHLNTWPFFLPLPHGQTMNKCCGQATTQITFFSAFICMPLLSLSLLPASAIPNCQPSLSIRVEAGVSAMQRRITRRASQIAAERASLTLATIESALPSVQEPVSAIPLKAASTSVEAAPATTTATAAVDNGKSLPTSAVLTEGAEVALRARV
ncbi:unnamed protein product [Mortierella alpina]